MTLFKRIDGWRYFVIITAVSVALDSFGGAADDLSTAESKFMEGVELFSSAQYQNALRLFEESYNIHPKANTVFNMAMCNKALMKNQESIALFEKYLKEYDGDQQMREDAMAAVDEILGLVGLVELVAVEDGAEILINEQLIGTTPLKQPLVLNPGVYQLSISLEGYELYIKTISISAGARNEIWAKLKRLSDLPASTAPAPQRPVAADSGRSVRSNAMLTAGLTVGATGILALGTGVFFSSKYIMNRSDGNLAAKKYREEWDERYVSKYHAAEANLEKNTVSIAVSYSVGGVLLISAIVMLAVKGRESESSDASRSDIKVGASAVSILF